MFGSHFRSSALFLFLTAVFLYTQLFIFPLTPVLFEGDHAMYLSNAYRLFLGEMPYRDFFLFQFPGTEVFYLFFFKLFGVEIWILNAAILFLLVSLAALGLYFSRMLLSGWAVYLPSTIFIVGEMRIFGADGSHRYFGVVFVFLAAAILLVRRTPARLCAAGVSCGIASCFTQQRGACAVAAIVLFLILEKFYDRQSFASCVKSILWVCLPFALVIASVSIYLIILVGFENFYFSIFVFPFKYYSADAYNNPRAYLTDFPDPQNLSVFSIVRQDAPRIFNYLLIPFIYPIFFAVLRIKKDAIPDEKKRQLIFLSLLGLFLGVFVLTAPSALRFYQVSLPGLVLLVWIFQNFFRAPKIVFSLGLALLTLLGFAYIFQRALLAPVTYLETPSGTIASLTSAENLSRYRWAAEHTKPGDFLYEPHHPSLYMMFHLRNPTPMPVVRANAITTVVQVEDIVKGLERNQPRYILWNGLWEAFDGSDAPGFHLQPLVNYVHKNYHPVENLYYDSQPQNDKIEEYKVEAWEKNEQAQGADARALEENK